MALEIRDRAGDTTATTGTGTVTLAGAPPSGLRTFASAGHTTGATVDYSISTLDKTEWEVGQGVWTSSGNTLTRVTVFASSNSGALVNFSAGTKEVVEVLVAARVRTVTHALNKLGVHLATGSLSHGGTGWEKFPYDTVDFDAAGAWDATNKRFAPTAAGYYQLTAALAIGGGGAAVLRIAVRMNGSTLYWVGGNMDAGADNVAGTVLLYFNGTTDYADVMMFTNAVRTFSNTVGQQFFQALGPL